MSNSWFQFKKFMVQQDKSAMKVGTDGVLLGAWTSVDGSSKILDAGTGTGLVALMLAQRSTAEIDAVEIDPGSAGQAMENIADSPWPGRIRVFCTSFQEHCKSTTESYDLVVCNPPFFSNSLRAKTNSRTLARHNDKLTLKELVEGSAAILKPNGRLCVILPATSEVEIISIVKEKNLFPSNILRIRPLPGKEFKRILIDFSFTKQKIHEDEIYLESAIHGQYSREYIILTQDFYLSNNS
jgi:tRNA1Val (adenine37-N6)-methyltransferase